jgi:uncharacterized membrane protein YgaE (UPF0421/DUF939 family)
MGIDQLRRLIIAKEDPSTFTHSARTAVAAVLSLLVAHVFRLPETYWAAITTLIVMQSTLGAAVPISAQRFAGTAVGAAGGALVGTYFPGNVFVFGLAVLVIGLVCAAFRVERSAYRCASITLAIVMLITRSQGEWAIAVHRFFEVSVGIAVGLVVTALWPERKSEGSDGFGSGGTADASILHLK